MLLDHQLVHPDLDPQHSGPVLHRRAARGVALRGDKILLLYTERYDDFSFPGGGLDEGESLDEGLVREVQEETGARQVHIGELLAVIDERRPHWHVDYPVMHMISHYYHCDIRGRLACAQMETYEKANGMRPMWVDLRKAIAHNRAVLQARPANMGQSIQRETLVLEWVLQHRRQWALAS